MISAHEIARTADVRSSHEAAAAKVRSGRAGLEMQAAIRAVNAHSGLTSKELAEASGYIGYEVLGQNDDEWRMTLARRLVNAEDRGMIEAEAPSLSRRRPERVVNHDIAPCRISGIRSLRWYAKGTL